MSPKTKKIAFGVGFAVFTVIVVVLLVVAITTHDEPTFLTGCDDAGGLNVDYSGDCYEIRPTLPLTVSATTTNPHPPADPEEATRAAIDVFNARARMRGHCEPFVYVDDIAEANVAVHIGEAVQVGVTLDGVAGAAQHSHRGAMFEDGQPFTSVVYTYNTGTVGFTHAVLVHELGHAAGLAHDPFEDSVMFYSTEAPDPTNLEDPGLRRLWVTDMDVDALGSLCP